MKNIFTLSLKKVLIGLVFLSLSFVAKAQNVFIPDANFKNALLANASVNTLNDGEISVAEANVYGGFLNVNGLGITDLTGIEEFINIDNLDCSDNQLVTLDVSSIPNLEYLYCFNNLLTSINVNANSSLLTLYASDNQLTSIDISNNPVLDVLFLENNSLTNIDVSNNGVLTSLNLTNNQLTSIDLFNNSQLQSLLLNDNQLSSLSVFMLANLTEIRCANNPITSLDLSNNPLLSTIVVFNCTVLTSLNLKNIDVFSIGFLNATGNPNLGCISVDDVANFDANWSAAIDGITTYNFNCDAFVNIPDGVFKNALTTNSVINPNLDGEITFGEAANYTGSIAVNFLGVSDLTGIEAFVNLTDLNCSNNTLSTLDLTSNSKLQSVDCSFNNLTTFSTPLTNVFTDLNCSNNQISSIFLDDVSGLVNFDCSFNNNLTSISVLQNTSLQTLDVSHCDISALDLSFNPLLTSLKCGSNNLTSLSLNDTPLITFLDFSDNGINSIDVSFITNVAYLDASSNPMSSIDISSNNSITSLLINYTAISTIPTFNNPGILNDLGCAGLGLSSIDISIYPLLGKLNCASNNLSSIDFSANPNLGNFICNNNNLTALDFSANLSIYYLDCSDNALTSLSVKNGAFTTYDGFDATNNPALTCIEVDDVAYFNTTWIAGKDAGASYNTVCSPCIVNIPDAIFKAALVADLTININADAEIQCGEAIAYTGSIVVNNLGIADLTGIEAFVNIIGLNCETNILTSIDVSANSALTVLDCRYNNITSLDVSANTALTELLCFNNQITSLNVSSNLALTILICGVNPINSLDVSANTALTVLDAPLNNLTTLDVSANTLLTNLSCHSNQLLSIDVSNNPALQFFACNNNLFSGIDVSNNPNLNYFYCNGNSISALDVSNNPLLLYLDCSSNNLNTIDVSNNPLVYQLFCSFNSLTALDLSANNLGELRCFNNNITSIDLSNSTNLYGLYCNDNQLTSLNIQNGNNSNITAFNATNNPALTCIQVSDEAFMNTNFGTIFNKDAIASYSTCCSGIVNIPDANFKAALVSNDLIDTNFDDEIQCGEASAYTSTIDVGNQNITDLTGIEAFINIVGLNFYDNNVTSVDISANSQLNFLGCSNNQLSVLDVSNNPILNSIICENNNLTTLDVTSNPFLSTLNVRNNNITTLDLTNNLNMVNLECYDNQISTLNLSNMSLLESLGCGLNQLTNLDISANPQLTYLECNDNQLTSLNLSNNLALTNIYCSNNQITSLDVSNHTSLLELFCSSNQIATLNVNNCPLLNTVACLFNQITSLDFTGQPLLVSLYCAGNQLTYLNIQNGNNSNLNDFTATINPALTCIQVDNVAYMNTTWSAGKDAGAIYSTCCTGGNVYIPDAAFKAALVGNDLIDTNFDDEIQCSEASAFNGTIDVNSLSIADLTGIEAFVNITDLNCSYNSLTNIDISANTFLQNLDLYSNQLSALDVSANVQLQNLFCGSNLLNAIDVINNTALTSFSCQENLISSLNVTSLLNLTYLSCNNNSLSSIDVSQNTLLDQLDVSANSLISIDITQNTLLTILLCQATTITSIDLSNNLALSQLYLNGNAGLNTIDLNNNLNLTFVNFANTPFTSLDFTNNIALYSIGLFNTDITSLDLTNQTSLTQLICSNTPLTSLNIQNGNNSNLTLFFANNNPSLTCIQVSDVAFMNTNFGGLSNKDAIASYNTTCGACLVNIPDANFKAALVANDLIDTNFDDEIQCDEASAYTGIIDVNTLGISDLTGIEAFVNVTGLYCYSNSLSSLNISTNTALTVLSCSGNLLTSLDVSNNLNLTELYCQFNQLTNLNLLTNTALTDIVCSFNLLTNLDVSANNALINLNCAGNQITSLDVSSNTALTRLNVISNQLAALDVSNNTNLLYLFTGFNSLNNIDLSLLLNLEDFDCSYNLISSIDLSANSQLIFLDVSGNQLTSLDLSNNLVLDLLQAYENQITAIDVSANTMITTVTVYDNNLSTLNLQNGNNTNMTIAAFLNAPLTCIQVDDVTYATSNWTGDVDPGAAFSLACNLSTTVTTFNASPACAGATVTVDWTVSQSFPFGNIFTVELSDASGSFASPIVLGTISSQIGNSLGVTIPNVTPAGTGYLVRVTSSTGGAIANIFGTNITILATPAAPVLAITDNCGNSDILANGITGTINWSDLGSGNPRNVLSGTYTATQTDGGCTSLISNSVTANPFPIITAFSTTITPQSCGLINGEVLITGVTGGVSPFTYSFDGSAQSGTTNYTGLVANTYGIVVVDVNGCTYTDNAIVNDLGGSAPLAPNLGGPFVQCAGSIQLDALNPGDTYVWSPNGETTQLINVTSSGLYSVTVSNACGSTFSNDVDITINSVPSTSTIFGNATPNCNATGQIYSVTNSTGSNYAWSVPPGAVITSGATGPNNSSIFVDFGNTNGNISVIETGINSCVGTQQDLAIALVGCGCLVNIPDVAFKTALVTNLAINTNADTEIQCTEASAFNGTINVDGLGINDLTGIEAFTAITQLRCNTNNLTSLNVATNTALSILDCRFNQITNLDVSTNTLLTEFRCTGNQLTTLDVSSNTALTIFACGSNQLTTLNVSSNTALVQFYCFNNLLTSLDVSNNVGLTIFWCYSNQLTSLDVSSNINLTQLDCGTNLLTSLNVNANVSLGDLSCKNNQLTALNLASNTSLSFLICGNNPITDLDLSQNGNLIRLYCSNMNALTSLNIQNGNNTNFVILDADSIPLLNCIQVDDVAYATSAPTWTKDATAGYSTNCSCVVNIPDNNFRNALLADVAINTDLDGVISCAEASAYNGAIVVNGLGITDLTGIEAFTSLTILNCGTNNLLALDVSSNIALDRLDCSSNQLSNLDVSANTVLTRLFCYDNLLTNLNGLTNTQLTYLYCFDNQLTSLDVSANPALIELWCSENQFTTLDVSTNTLLTSLTCHGNQLTSLDVSANVVLLNIYCQNNQLTSLNIQNGNNSNFTNFNSTNNPSLTCIQVDNAAYMNTNWIANKDAGATYSVVCPLCIVNIPDVSFKTALLAIPGLDANSDSEIQCAEAASYAGGIIVNNLNIADLTGIEAFTLITNLECGDNQLTSLDVSTNTALALLVCYNNQLTSLDLSANTALQTLNCADNQITGLNLTSNTLLDYIECRNNQLTSLTLPVNAAATSIFCGSNLLTSLDLSGTTGLVYLECQNNQLASLVLPPNSSNSAIYCYNNQLTNLDITAFTGLQHLEAGNNQLTSINMLNNTALDYLVINDNLLTGLDLSNNTLLNALNCVNNQITALDLSNMPSLVYLDCESNQLTSLNAQNGNNTNFTGFYSNNNSSLNCIQVDNPAYSATAPNWIKDATAGYSTSCACVVNIPDNNFRVALLANAAINADLDGVISCAEATAYNGILNVDFLGITDLTGIEAFVNITELYCSNNSLTSINITNNTLITRFACEVNQLTTIDLSANTLLTYIDVTNNQLTSIDLSNNNQLVEFLCTFNSITNLDFSANPLLELVIAGANAINSVNLTNNPVLRSLTIGQGLTSLDLSNLPLLEELYCSGSPLLTSLDFTNNPNLTRIECAFDGLTSIDISANPNVNNIQVQNNNLSSLNIQNGNNSIITTFNATNNPLLTCIQVSDVTYMNTNLGGLSNKDAGATYNTSCACLVNIPDANFKAALVANDFIDTDFDDEISCAEAAAYNSFIDVQNLGITDLTGIEAFTSINALYCDGNLLTSLDVSANTALTYLQCFNNQLTSLDVSSNVNLNNLHCSNNQITNLDVSNNTALVQLTCAENLLTNINVSNNPVLDYFTCYSNQLANLDVSSSTALTFLNCYNNLLATLDVSANTGLTVLACGSNQITTLDVTVNTALTSLTCENSLLTSLDVSTNTALAELWCFWNQIAALDFTTNTSLTTLLCYGNFISSLDVSSNTLLTNLFCSQNQLSNLDLSANAVLQYLNCKDNQLINLNVQNGNNNNLAQFDAINNPTLTCIQVDDATFMNTTWSGGKDAGATYSTVCPLPCLVNIPDAIFKAALVAIPGLDANSDLEIQCSEASAYSGAMNLTGLGINDLTGIEAFTALTGLNCSLNNLTGINLNSNTALLTLNCSGNALSSIDVSNNTLLQTLQCHNIQISTIDVTNNTALTILDVSLNSISTIDLSNNTSLITLFCGQNPLTTLNVSNNIALQDLYCEIAQLTSLDVLSNVALLNLNCSENSILTLDLAANTALQTLDCAVNQLSALNVSNNTNLTSLSAALNNITNLDVTSNLLLQTFTVNNNLITSIDVSANTALTTITCSNNALTSLNIQNGNNSNLVFFEALNNPSLTCIQVDDASYSNTAPNWFKDAAATYSVSCGLIADFTANITTVCQNGAVIFTNQSTGTTGGTTYAWDFGAGANPPSAIGAGPHTVIYSTAGTADVSLTVTDGITDTKTSLAYININAKPTIPAINLADNCGNSVLTVSGLTDPFTWTDGDLTNPRTVLSSGTFGVFQTALGCNSDTAFASANPLTIPAPPTLNVVDNCGASVITALGVIGVLNWSDFGAGNPRVETSGTFTATQDVAGCVSATSNSVTVNPLAVPSTSLISGNMIPNCAATGQTYAVVLNAGSNYAWSVPIDAVVTSGAIGPDNHSITVDFGTTNGIISVVETNSVGCTGLSVDTIISLQGCALAANFTADVTTICEGASVTFTDLSTGTTGSTAYAWNFGNGQVANTSGPHVIQYNLNGSFTVGLTITEGASSTQTFTNYITVNSPTNGTDVQTACDTYTWIDGLTYNASTNAPTFLLTNAAGCDSLVTLNLTINNSTNGTDVQTACDTYTWIDGLTYNASTNTPTFLLTNAVGCDSLVTLNLTINNSTNGTDVQTACDTYTWIDGLTYNASTNAPTFLLTNAAGCDSLVTLNLTINNSTNGTDVQTACDTYTWIDGLTYNASTNTPTFLLTNAVGCDSLVTLNLTINNSTNGTDVQTACDTYTWIDGLTYNASTNTPTFLLTNAAGCDSLVTLNLTINNSTNGTDVQTACDTYTWIDGLTYNASTNTPTFLLTNAAGCDSLVTLNLTINNSTNGTDVQIACDTYTWIDGLTYNASTNAPTFLLTNAAGCDSLVTLNLTINNSTNGTDVQTACDTYTWIDGLTYNASTNTPTFLLTNAAGCDSLVTLNLTINNSTNGTDVQTACDTYTWIDGLTYNASTNTPTFLLTNAVGCDSLVTLNLTINNSTNGTDVQTACDTYTWIDGLTYNASTNTPTFLLTNAAGCDSLVTLNLTINNSTNGTDVQTACDTYTWIDGLTYNASTNTPTFLLTNAVGCDSLVTLNLTINNSTNGTDVQTACDTYTWIDGLTYNASTNTPTFLLTNAAGCDSLVTLNLTINNSTNGTDVQTACDTYTWIDGLTYNASTNAPTFLLTNAAGCDSLVTLNLTINNSTNGTDIQTACDTYTWIDGLTYNASTNTPTFLLTNAVGCDSLVTLNLTINNSTNGTDVQTACDTYTWIDGLTYNASTNTPTFLLTNAAGCDSLVTLNLTINNSTNGTDVQTACDTYTWIDGLTYNASTNAPTFLLTNAAGCDSLVTLNLTINNSTNGTDVQTACDTYTWIDGLTYNASTNAPTFLLTNAAGCDSLVTLNLTINNSTNGTDIQTACDTYTWIDGLTYNASTNAPTFLLTNAAGCDSLVTLNLTINNSTNGTDVQTACDTYTWIDGLTYIASTNTPTFLLTNAAGCDSLVTLNLTINNSTNGTDIQTACDTYTWIDGLTYNASTNTPTFLLTNAAGCDSLVTLNLTINNSTNGTDVQTACDTYTWIDGLTYNASTNTPTFLLTNAAGCDSLVTLNLTINNSTNGTDVQTACDTYTWIDGLTYNASTNTPTFLLTNAAGCDSLVTLNLTINNSTNGTDVQTACDTYTWIDGLTYNASINTPTFLLTNAAGCDSLVTLNLTINNSTNGTDVQTACDTYTWIDGLTYNASTNAPTFLLTNAAGCDSLVTLNLTINNSTNGTDVQTACDTYTWIDGLTYNASTNAPTFLLTNAAGCDSLVTLNLTINNSTNGTDVQTACDTYTWIDGLTYNASTNAPTFLLTNAAGCDSLVTLNLTINNSTNGTDVQTACDTYTWIDGLTYNASTNAPTFLLTNAAGCDSLVTLNLTINNSTNGTDVQTACDTYTWIDGLTYNASTNAPTFLLTNAAGCDSLVTLNLTINNSTNGTDVQTACDTYTWIDGLTYNASTNAPTFLLTNAAGCDSLVTLNLTINNSTNGTDVQTACDTYTWIDGLTYNASTNAPTFLLTNAAGCDSLVTLNLTINNSTNGTDVQTACDTYTWIDGLTYNASTNAPTFLLTNAAGCDSLVTLNLTINNSTNGTDVQTACDTYTWIDGLTYNATTNAPTFLLTNAAGCDSLVTLNLTINNSTNGTDVQTACDTYTWIDGLTYNASTNAPTFLLTNAAGCDSLVTLNLTINNSTNGTDVQTACDTYTWIDGLTYNASTNAPTFLLTNAAGCDSLVTLNLTINNSTNGTDVQTACDTYTWIDGLTYNASTNTPTFTYIGGSVNGCDSIVTLNLTINNGATGTDIQTACDTYTWIDGLTYNASTNTPTFTYIGGSVNGCDSIVTLNLTINNGATGTDIQTACDTYTWIDGLTYNASTNTPTFTYVGGSVNGCDSIVTLNLTINITPAAPTLVVVDNCGSSDVTASGITGTLIWSDLGTGNPRNFLTPTTLTVTQDLGGCISVASNSVTTNPLGITSITNTTINETCGLANGSYDVTGVTGGIATYTYSTDGITYVTNTLFNGLSAGAYTIYVQDANSCVYEEPFNISNTAGVTSITNTTVDATCGLANGSYDITGITAGTAPYNYSIDGITYGGNTLFTGLAAGAYTIYVQDNNNCVYTEPFSISTSVAPITSAITGNTNPICSETGVTYSVVLTAGSSYAWTVPTGSIITSGLTGPDNNVITVDLGSTNGNIAVTETNTAGCVGVSQSLVIGLQGCGLVANFSADTDTICEGASVTFTDLSTGTTGATTYFWDFGPSAVPSTATGQGPHVITYIAPGPASVSLTVTDGIVSTLNNPNFITVNPILTPTVSITVSNSTICGPTMVDFNSNVINGGTNPSYQWQLNGIDIVGANADSLNISTLIETDVISLNVISNETCLSVPNASSNQITITDSCDAIITTLPIALNAYCAGSSLTVNYTVAGTVNSNNVFIAQLSNATGSFATPTNIGQLTSTTSGAITATIPENTNAGLQYRIRVVSNSPNITGTDNGSDINVNTVNFGVDFSIANVNLSSLPMDAQFTNNTPNLNQYNFTWFFGDGSQAVINTASVNYIYNYNGSYDVSLVATDNTTGCSQTFYDTLNTILCSGFSTNACNHSASINAPNVINGCAGSQLNLNVNNYNPTFSYQWHRNGAAINGGNYESITINTSGFYSVTVFDTAGCPKTSNPIQVSFNLPSVTAPVVSISGLVGNCGQVNATLTAIGNFASYLWNTGANADSINISQAGTYSVIGQGSLGCDAVSAPFAVSSSFLPTPTICMVTVDTLTNHHLLMWEKPASSQIQAFAIYKEIPFNSNNYQQIVVLPYDSLSEYLDLNSNASLVTDRYRLTFIDTCNGETAQSDFVRAIGLKVFPGVGVQRVLSWNSYTGAAQNITSYLVYSGPDNANLNLIATIQPGAAPFIDSNPIAGSNTVYRVETELSQSCESTRAIRNKSVSNSSGNSAVSYPDVSIKELAISKYKFNILPNPSNGNFIINWENAQIAPDAKVWIESVYGEKVTTPALMTESNTAISINVQSGVYFVRVNSSAGEWVTRLVIVN